MLKTSVPTSQKNNKSTLKRPTEGIFTIFLRNISSAKKGRAVWFEILVALFVITRVCWDMKPCRVLCGGNTAMEAR